MRPRIDLRGMVWVLLRLLLFLFLLYISVFSCVVFIFSTNRQPVGAIFSTANFKKTNVDIIFKCSKDIAALVVYFNRR